MNLMHSHHALMICWKNERSHLCRIPALYNFLDKAWPITPFCAVIWSTCSSLFSWFATNQQISFAAHFKCSGFIMLLHSSVPPTMLFPQPRTFLHFNSISSVISANRNVILAYRLLPWAGLPQHMHLHPGTNHAPWSLPVFPSEFYTLHLGHLLVSLTCTTAPSVWNAMNRTSEWMKGLLCALTIFIYRIMKQELMWKYSLSL